LDWADLGADNRRAWRLSCQSEWDAQRSDLEAREIPAAEDACVDASETLDSLGCAELRALYVPIGR
jgi:hypothetical protein